MAGGSFTAAAVALAPAAAPVGPAGCPAAGGAGEGVPAAAAPGGFAGEGGVCAAVGSGLLWGPELHAAAARTRMSSRFMFRSPGWGALRATAARPACFQA